LKRRWLRRGLFGALLLVGVAFIVAFIRLDDAALHAQVEAQLEQVTGRTVHGGKTRLSLQHGVSLKISNLKLDGPGGDWELQADVVRFDLSIGSLLIGDLRVSGVDMVHPVLRLSGTIPPAELFSGPLVARLMQQTPLLSFRQGRIELRDEVLADEVAATLRRIDREQQTTWEVQSRYAGGDFSSQGYIRSGNGAGDRVFGRISATQLQLANIAGLPLPSLHYDVLDASLTFSLDAAGQWSWFGNMLTRDEHAELPELSWRGKVSGSSLEDFRLHDAFVQFGEKTRLVLLGGCESGHPCGLEIETRAANPGLILKAGGIDIPLQGKLDGRVELSEMGDGWNLNGKVALRSMKWGKTHLPDSQMELSGLHMESPERFLLGHAVIQPVDTSLGSIEITRLQQKDDAFSVSARLLELNGIWSSIGGVLLQRSGLTAATGEPVPISGSGIMNGSVDWMAKDGDSSLHFDLTAADAAIAFGKAFAKPAGVAAGLSGTYRCEPESSRLELVGVRLGESKLGKLQLAFSDAPLQLSVAGAQLDLDKLKAQGVLLPGVLAGWRGAIRGDVADVVAGAGMDMRTRLAAASGHLQLDRFGFEDQSFSGPLGLKAGHLKAEKLNWQRGTDFAELTADLDLGRLRGSVNILRAGFKWSPEASLPDWLREADIRGRFKQTDMLWNDNVWKGMKGGFVARKASLKLDHVSGGLEGGLVQSRSMEIKGVPGGIHFSGLLGMSAVRLNQLQGMSDATGATMNGYIFANARLAGSLPVGSGPWRGNGDIEIHRGLWKEARAAHHILWLDDAAAKLVDGDRFDRLNVRFRFTDDALQFRRLVFNRDSMTAKGEATLSAQGDVSGALDVRQGDVSLRTGLGGRWPSLNGFLQSAAGR